MSVAATVNNGQTVYVGIPDTVYLDVTPATLLAAAGVSVTLARPTDPSPITVAATIVDADTISIALDSAFVASANTGRWYAVATITDAVGNSVPHPSVLAGRPVITLAQLHAP